MGVTQRVAVRMHGGYKLAAGCRKALVNARWVCFLAQTGLEKTLFAF